MDSASQKHVAVVEGRDDRDSCEPSSDWFYCAHEHRDTYLVSSQEMLSKKDLDLS